MTGPRRTKSGAIDGRTREARRKAATMPAVEIEQMVRLIVPGVQAASQALQAACQRVYAFRAAHPELAAMEQAVNVAMEANNNAVLPLWGLLNKLEEQDPSRAREWYDFLNGEGPQPGGVG